MNSRNTNNDPASAARMPQRGNDSRSGSPSREYEYTPKDRHRRRSRSFNSAVPRSVLDRARPVPAEYHSFNDGPVQSNLPKTKSFPAPDRSGDLNAQGSLPQAMQQATGVGNVATNRRYVGSIAGENNDLPGLPPPGSDRQTSSSYSYVQQGMEYGARDAYGAPDRSSIKERPGFFRRMFTSSKNSSVTLSSHQPPQLPPMRVETHGDVPDQRGGTDANVQTSRHADTATPAPVPVTAVEANSRPPQTLHNKRSFFRRRRKTVTDKDIASSSRDGSVHQKSDHPSMSSLRKVMDPYIAKDQAMEDRYFDSVEAQPIIRRHEKDYADASTQGTAQGKGQAKASKRQGGSRDEVVRRAPSHRPSTSITRPADANSATMHKPTQAETLQQVAGHEGLDNGAPGPTTTATMRTFEDIQQADVQPSTTQSAQGHNLAGPSDTNRQPTPIPANADANDAQNDQWQLKAPDHDAKPSSIRSNRIFIQDDGSHDAVGERDMSSALDGPPQSPSQARAARSEGSLPNEDYASARSMPIVQVEGQEENIVVTPPPMDEVPRHVSEAEQRDIDRAKKIWEAQNDPITRDYGALELGESGEAGDRLRIAFMAFFDFSGLNVLLALRDLCGRMTLKGETQQMDRIMSAFSERWCECNPNHGFKNEDVVHTICYSLLLLNTDLHVADLTDKMTRTQFVKNTVPTLRRIAEAAPGMAVAGANTWPERAHKRGSLASHAPRSPSPSSTFDLRPSVEGRATSSRLSNKRMLRPTSDVPSFVSPGPYDVHAVDASELLVNAPQEGNMRTWEIALETVLKEFYLSIRQLRLPLHGATDVQLHEQPSSNSLSVVSTFMRRTGSVVSKAPSEDSRGRAPSARSVASRWTSKTRSRPRIYPTSTFGSSYSASRTSLEGDGLWSPSASSTWSKSFGNTQTSMSTDSLSSRFAHADPGYQQSIGFANALSHAIIREEGFTNPDEAVEGAPPTLLEDESLGLAGAPWAKEGIVQHKHHLETTDKKAKDRNWSECFAVVEKGILRLFSFNTGKSSIRSQKGAKSPGAKGAVVGGGNWMDNAQAVGSLTLRQTIANTLPPPGYSKVRPHVFALSLPNGAVHLFHVGTPEIAREFVSTANYWSARLSKEPLVGGVSNVEYGWGDSVINTALLNSTKAVHAPSGSNASARSITTPSNPPSSYHVPRTESSLSAPPHRATGSTGGGGGGGHSRDHSASLSIPHSSRSSLQGSIRSSFEGSTRPAAFRTRQPTDRLALAEWTPPQQSLMASALSAPAQLEALRRYVRSVEEELERHNELRAAVVLAFTPRGPNATKALGNWERKSSYLLREIVKFRTYVDVLGMAEVERRRIKGETKGGAGEAGAVGVAGDDAAMHDTGAGAGVSAGKGRVGAIRKVLAKEEEADDEELSEETLEALRAAKLGGRPRSGTTSTG